MVVWGGGTFPVAVLLIWGACSIFCARTARRSGRDELTGAWIGLIFGPLGVMYMLASGIKHDVTPGAAPKPPYQVAVYRGATQAEAARAFAVDAPRAAEWGYEPLDQAWEGSTLTVTYRLR